MRFVPNDPELIAQDERILWQGRPLASGFIRNVFPTRLLIAYFAALTAWTAAAGWYQGLRPDAVFGTLWLGAGGAAIVFALIAAVAFLMSVTTRYVITTSRILLQIGIAMPIALTVPLKKITSVDLRLYPNGSGDIPLALGDEKIAYLLLWPHARPWRFSSPQPMLRAVASARDVAAVLSQALQAVQRA